MTVQLTPIPALKDNYIWALHDDRYAVVVDPGEVAPVLAWLNGRHLLAVLITHRHPDHWGGVPGLLERHPAPVYGPTNETVPGVSHPVGEGDVIEFPPLGLQLQVFDIPGHTQGHVAYLGAGALFCGDTLFGAGCGRIFDGTAAQLYASLQRIVRLPDETRVCCAHEYTEANLRFALACEPDNLAIRQRVVDVRELRAAGQPSLPSSIATEKVTNPFLRCHVAEVAASAAAATGRSLPDELAVFTALRAWRNDF